MGEWGIGSGAPALLRETHSGFPETTMPLLRGNECRLPSASSVTVSAVSCEEEGSQW